MLYTLMTLLAAQAAQLPVQCGPASGPAVLVKISGFKNREGRVRVRLFGGPPPTYFDKRQATVRTEVAVPRHGAVTMCVAAPKAGIYAVDVRHDANGNGKTDRADGGGTSGNPDIGLIDVLFKRRPDARIVQVRVGAGTTVVPITLKYLQGGSFKAVAAE